MSPPILASFASLDPTNGNNNAIQNPAAPPSAAIIRWLRGGATRVSSRLFPDASPAHTARKPCSCFSAANLAFLYAPSSSPNIRRMNRRRSPLPKLHSTEPKRPTASPFTGPIHPSSNPGTIHFHFPLSRITSSSIAAAPPYRCTRLPSLQAYYPTHAYNIHAIVSSTIQVHPPAPLPQQLEQISQ